MEATASNAKGSTGNSQTTPLTPSTSCTATGSGDSNNSTSVEFDWVPSGLNCWTALVSVAQQEYVLKDDKYCIKDEFAGPLFKQGLTIRYSPNENSSGYLVTLTGTIIDPDGRPFQYQDIVIYQSN